MKVLDLFSGLDGFSQAFKDKGHDVFTVDIDSSFCPDLASDVLSLKPSDFPFKPDVILASPPCNNFSIAAGDRHWHREGTMYFPKNPDTVESIKLVWHTLYLIYSLKPTFWFLENPRGMLRHIIGKPRTTITWCRYGDSRMKPTDIWGVFPKSIKWKEACSKGDSCHVSCSDGNNPPGSTVWISSPALRSKIPYQLSQAVCIACETSLETGSVMPQTILDYSCPKKEGCK